MKQAILITAYKNISHLQRIVDFFDDDYFFFIHIDTKSKISNFDIENLKASSKVKLVSQKYKVNWGSIDHLKAILLLCRETVKYPQIEYIHLITGQDFPIKSSKQITDFLEENRGTEFLSARPLPLKSWKNGGLDRVLYYNPYELFNAKSWQRIFIKTFVNLQKLVGFKRKLPYDTHILYGGSTYWTLSRQAVEYFLSYLDTHTEVLNSFKYTFCAEEILLHTIIMNSPFKEKVCKDNLRFMVWEYRDGISPANLDERDYNEIIKSNAFFARKFEYPVSESLYLKLKSTFSNNQ